MLHDFILLIDVASRILLTTLTSSMHGGESWIEAVLTPPSEIFHVVDRLTVGECASFARCMARSNDPRSSVPAQPFGSDRRYYLFAKAGGRPQIAVVVNA
jgi:hypothetical protein